MNPHRPALALHGGAKAVVDDPGDIFKWPIVTKEDEDAVLAVLRAGNMSDTDVTEQFEKEFCAWTGCRYALGYCNGTESLRAAIWACGVGAGDEIICPAHTYWASATMALGLGAAVNFADYQADTLCIDPDDIQHRIGPRTKVIVVVHINGHPCDMDAIMAIAKRHDLKVVEDVSHAHGGLYKGRMVGTIGDIGAMSLMSTKSLPAGEAGMLITNDRRLFERAVAYGHYERTTVASEYSDTDSYVTDDDLRVFAGLPLGGYKHRMNQTCAAMGRVQLKHYPRRMAEIQKAMNRFWDMLEGAPGIRAHRPPRDSGSTMGGWYSPKGLYRAEEFGGLQLDRFCQAVRAEGVTVCNNAINPPLHLHPVFQQADIFNQGKATVIAFGQRDVRQGPGSLPVTESAGCRVFTIPYFKHDRPEIITQYASAYRKVAEHADELHETG